MTQTDQLDAAKKDYGALVWEGASASDRLASLVQTLETWFPPPILRARAWNTQDGRDVRYRAWLEAALAEHEQLVNSGAAAQTRLDSIRRMASRALDFERQPSELMVAPRGADTDGGSSGDACRCLDAWPVVAPVAVIVFPRPTAAGRSRRRRWRNRRLVKAAAPAETGSM